jgi:hypothetical protein
MCNQHDSHFSIAEVVNEEIKKFIT